MGRIGTRGILRCFGGKYVLARLGCPFDVDAVDGLLAGGLGSGFRHWWTRSGGRERGVSAGRIGSVGGELGKSVGCGGNGISDRSHESHGL